MHGPEFAKDGAGWIERHYSLRSSSSSRCDVGPNGSARDALDAKWTSNWSSAIPRCYHGVLLSSSVAQQWCSQALAWGLKPLRPPKLKLALLRPPHHPRKQYMTITVGVLVKQKQLCGGFLDLKPTTEHYRLTISSWLELHGKIPRPLPPASQISWLRPYRSSTSTLSGSGGVSGRRWWMLRWVKTSNYNEIVSDRRFTTAVLRWPAGRRCIYLSAPMQRDVLPHLPVYDGNKPSRRHAFADTMWGPT